MMNELTAQNIIQLLEASTHDRRPTSKWIAKNAPITELIKALQQSPTSLARQILCDILGQRRAQRAISVLIECLADVDPGVRASAVEALGKIGNPRAGEVLLKRFNGVEEDVGVRHMLAGALGAVSYRPAIPFLIQALKDSDEVLRGCAAWSLGVLKAQEAEKPLQDALVAAEEQESYTINRVQEALKNIKGSLAV